ncbi:putative protein gravitropic in the light 1 [Helianthus annuus]|uniref:DUF641 domain-containing protein n=1 Tax=Helianthus annuus TaxID=4232 RepID=A0A9K3MYW9_HELAN|nr:protein GRAVITROPIC IN THE LIGHT 1-like [Helianthus annuus]KAF5780800.1 putative protein gravitropic in the light 1 [Helianthus annuus]KAJ0684393.1 putative protein gravitropic in the light 1 [Helianthus annuus]KAJ0688336.1 putative protein gravitropic in the light 1 [Helianthus annuus]KAJ0869459.1 putative protein gravitropic in the light 1 [Helianthus annuus]KAJ0873991.1 putative protein gravitropic in the light 1 [Helianthus annuus]
MDSLTQHTLTPTKTKFSTTFAKVLHIQKPKSTQKVKPHIHQHDQKLHNLNNNNNNNNQPTMDAFIAKLFATISSVKAAYAQLQVAQSPYNPEAIQHADQILVSELKRLSEYKQLFLKNHLDDDDVNSPETTQLLAEIQEQKNLVQMYDITLKNLNSQNKLKDSEIIFLKEKLNDTNKDNKMIQRRLNSNSFNEKMKISFSSITVNSFLLALHQTVKSVKSFVKFLMDAMEDANWDLNAAVSSIQPDVCFGDVSQQFFAFESFVCRVMFDGFNDSGFSITNNGFESGSGSWSPRFFYDSFIELKSLKAQDYITWKPNSTFARFCWLKYLKLVHPVMEFSLFGNLNQRNLVSDGKFPETNFFSAFADVARRVWLLHCLANAFDSNVPSVFQVREGSRFTEVFMESVNDEAGNASPEVGFTVVPGFKVGGTVIQCQVYLT